MATCNVNQLLQEASCLSCLGEAELSAVILQVLCELTQATPGGAGVNCVPTFSFPVDPSIPGVNGATFAFAQTQIFFQVCSGAGGGEWFIDNPPPDAIADLTYDCSLNSDVSCEEEVRQINLDWGVWIKPNAGYWAGWFSDSMAAGVNPGTTEVLTF